MKISAATVGLGIVAVWILWWASCEVINKFRTAPTALVTASAPAAPAPAPRPASAPSAGTTAGKPAGTPAAPSASAAGGDTVRTRDIVVGTGAEAKPGDTVTVLYTGKLQDGTVFDSSEKHGGQPFDFTLGSGNVIKGWDLGVKGMRVGGKRELTIPPSLGYPEGTPDGTIPAGATLTFEVELKSLKPGL